MAKKVIAGLRKATGAVKVIRPIKSEKTGKYRFKEEVIAKENLQEYLQKK
jgi:hypothetical protein